MADAYEKLIALLQKYGEVLTEHIGEKNVIMSESGSYTDDFIYKRDMSWLNDSDVVVAEVSTPSLGVGFEIGYAVEVNKPVLCLYKIGAEYQLSAMISGCPEIEVQNYDHLEELVKPIEKFIRKYHPL